MLNAKLARANFRVLPIDIPLARNAIGNDLNKRFHIVGAVLFKPFHYYGINACQIEFYFDSLIDQEKCIQQFRSSERDLTHLSE